MLDLTPRALSSSREAQAGGVDGLGTMAAENKGAREPGRVHRLLQARGSQPKLLQDTRPAARVRVSAGARRGAGGEEGCTGQGAGGCLAVLEV